LAGDTTSDEPMAKNTSDCSECHTSWEGGQGRRDPKRLRAFNPSYAPPEVCEAPVTVSVPTM
jgi:hypothetical protein